MDRLCIGWALLVRHQTFPVVVSGRVLNCYHQLHGSRLCISADCKALDLSLIVLELSSLFRETSLFWDRCRHSPEA